MSLQRTDFEYELPRELIAQHPTAQRDAARLMVHAVGADETEHRQVCDLLDYLRPGDLLVVNNTRVLPSRLFGQRATGGRVELFLLEPSADQPGAWSAMVNPARKLKPGERVQLEGGALEAEMIERELDAEGKPGAQWLVRLLPSAEDPGDANTLDLLEAHGHIPLPPYIEREPGDGQEAADRERYQTVFAEQKGAVAAPTAGLHFTLEMLERAAAMGVELAEVTLHVGHGTFHPVQVDDITQHPIHSERYDLDESVAEAVRATRERGGRVIAVGTTSVRVLETCAAKNGQVQPGSGSTRLFLYPGKSFQVVDAMLTNFHLPHSSLLMLVSAFAGTERTLGLYKEAVERNYRFFSYGDAMFLHSR